MAQGLQVIGLGLATLDILIRLDQMPTWKSGAQVDSFCFDGGGLVGTAMVAAARLGARAGFVGLAGSDEAAELKLRSFVAAGVDLSHLVRRPGSEGQVVAVFVHGETGERVFAGLQRLHGDQISVDELDRVYLTSAPYLHLDGFSAEAALQAARWMQEAGGTVVLDCSTTDRPVPEHRRELVRHVDVLISGKGFARQLTGIDDIYRAGEAILAMGPRIFVETVGDQGCHTVTAEDRFHTPAFPVEVVDTTGAGDVFHGAYIVGMLHGWEVRQVAQFASAVSAIKCTQLGGRAGIPSLDQALAFLREQGIMLTI